MTKIVAIMGSYRRDGIVEQAVDAMLDSAIEAGAEAEKFVLADESIEFCTNCRKCTGPELPGMRRADCIFDDRMHDICEAIDDADGIILAAPINFFSVNALMKRFIERLLVYVYWPWEKPMPKPRISKLDKKAVVMTSSACPAFLGRWVLPQRDQRHERGGKTGRCQGCTQAIFRHGLQRRAPAFELRPGFESTKGGPVARTELILPVTQAEQSSQPNLWTRRGKYVRHWGNP